MRYEDTEFNRGAIRPLVCYREGWRLIKEDYWLFVAICFVGMFIGYTIPFGILVGPMWCGFEIYLFRRMAGQRGSFGDLFEGFQYFAPSAVPGVLLVTLATVAFVLVYVVYFAATMSVLIAELAQGGGPPGVTFIGAFSGLTVLYVIGAIAAWAGFTSPFMFVFCLIVDRRLSGFTALVTSIRAMLGNLGGVLTLLFFDLVLSWIGTFVGCIAGWYLLVPLVLAANAVAYRQVFPRLLPEDGEWEEPEEAPAARPATGAGAPSTDIRSGSPQRTDSQTAITSGHPREQELS